MANGLISTKVPERTQLYPAYQSISWTLADFESKFFKLIARERELEGKPQVLWGWKRDLVINKRRYPESRTVYFSADFGLKRNKLYLKRAYFFLDTRAKQRQIAQLLNHVGRSRMIRTYKLLVHQWMKTSYPNYARMRIEIGDPCDYDRKTITRRLKGKPRLSLESPRLVPECQDYDLSKYAPFALCVGSGISSESGLPLLGAIHSLFEVDDYETGELIFGSRDKLPKRIISNVSGEFKKFCRFSVAAIKARPSQSHYLLVDLWKKGLVKEIFTDNMDDLLAKVGLPYIQTRTSIFPDRYPIADKLGSGAKSLLVVGVAVDRRDVIRQARRAGLKVIAINPVYDVAPHSRNMDYLRKGDILFKEEVREALPKIISASGF